MFKAALALVLSATVSGHYGDPYRNGCEKDEVAAQINGIAGKLCIPPCNSDGSCPTDVPAGVTATPKCVLKSNTGSQFCALVCNATGAILRPEDAQCGKDASCKAATSNGLCTYDDAPPPASSKHWKPVVSPTFQALSVALVVAFDKTGTTGFVGGGSNGVGAQILKSVDSGVTWKQVWPTGGKPGANLCLASAAKSDTSAVVTGAIIQQYTTDGQNFEASTDEFVEPSQDAKIMPNGDYAIAISGNKVNGVGTSPDGKTWKGIDIGASAATYPSRYGAYPSDSTWYVTAGAWPESPTPSASNLRHLTSKVAVNLDTNSLHLKPVQKEVEFSFIGATADSTPAPAAGNWSAGIFKTSDAGKTWDQVFADTTSGFYPNDIGCFSEDSCIAVVEGTNCQILLTTDGGKNWNSTNSDPDSACSLTNVAVLSATEAWVGGGHMSSLDFEGRYWHTTDAGNTWTKEAIKGLYIFSMDMTSAKSGYSVALTITSGVQLLKYDAAGL